jgi:uncharacterized protein
VLRTNIAFDYASARTTDIDGRLFVVDCKISKANVCDYLGTEIPESESLGLVPDKLYRLYRDASALKAAAASFEGLQLMDNHVVTSAADPQAMRTVGSVSNVRWKAPYLVADLSVWTADAIARIQDGSQREISCAYRYRVDMRPGTAPDGTPFDARMLEILGNHVALVEEGRVGHDVVVADASLDCEIEPDDTEITIDTAHRRRRPIAVDTVVEIDFAARIRGYTRLP